MAPPGIEGLDEVDLNALRRALDETMAEPDPSRREQMLYKLRTEAWVEVARFAAAHRQRVMLGLRPWQIPPCMGSKRDPAALALLDRMLMFGLSRFEPDLLAALDEAEAEEAEQT
jgi:hypothetical protein